MVLRLRATATGWAKEWPSGWIRAAARAHPRRVIVTLSASAGLLTTLAWLTSLGRLTGRFGAGGTGIFLVLAAPQGWAVGIMTYTLLTPAVPGMPQRQVVSGRWLLWSTLPVLLVGQLPFIHYGHRLDLLLLSGWLVLLIGLELARHTPVMLARTLRRLSDRGVLGPPDIARSLAVDLNREWRGWWVVSAAGVGGALLVTSVWIVIASGGAPAWVLGPAAADALFQAVAGAVAGSWLGRMVSYGRLIGKAGLRRNKLVLRVIPGHPDGAGGLKPLGDFYLFQSLTASLPAVFLAVWVLLFSLGGPSPLWSAYRVYLDPYVVLLAAAILFEVLVFVLPMKSAHDLMNQQKHDLFLPEADRLFPAGAPGQPGSPALPPSPDDAAVQQRLVERFNELNNAPTWPIDASIRRRFALRNLALLVPFIGYLVGHMQFWQQVADTFKGLG
jgi:hypothetical protein